MPTRKTKPEVKVRTRKDIFGRDVKVVKTKNSKTRTVTGDYVAKTRTSRDVKGGKRVTKSRIELDKEMGVGNVRNVTKYTGLAGLKRVLTPNKYRKDVNKVAGVVNPKLAAETGNKKSVTQSIIPRYKGKNLPRTYNK
jgi:hypothetical protein